MESRARAFVEEREKVRARRARVVREEGPSPRGPRGGGRALAVQGGEPREGERDDGFGVESRGGGDRVQRVAAEDEDGERRRGGEVSRVGDVDELVVAEVEAREGGGEAARGPGEGRDGVVAQVEAREARARGEVAKDLARVVAHVQSLEAALRVEALEARDAVAREGEVREVMARPEPGDGHQRVVRRVQVEQPHVLLQIEADEAVAPHVQGLEQGHVLQARQLEQGVPGEIQPPEVPRVMRHPAEVGERGETPPAPVQGRDLASAPTRGRVGRGKTPARRGGRHLRRHGDPRASGTAR